MRDKPISIESKIINNDERCACALVLDVSQSMEGGKIDALNEGLNAFEKQMKGNDLVARRVEVALFTVGGSGAQMEHDFVPIGEFQAPVLQADGSTPLGEGVRLALQAIRGKKREYRSLGIQHYRPWLVLMTDGEPTDHDWEAAAEEVCREENNKGVVCFPIGIGGDVNLHKLGKFSKTHPPVTLAGLEFSKLFEWLSTSLQSVSQSLPGEMAELPSISSWAQVRV